MLFREGKFTSEQIMPARPYIVLATLAVALLPGAAFGGDWTVVRLRGGVFTLENGQWQPLKRGDRVSDARLIQTAGNGRVTFQQGAQVLDLGPDTQVQIIDFAGDTKTTVWQHQGVVDVTAEARNTEHFSVQTPYLAAVVKGTTFRVTSDRGASTVDVTSGRVSVHDHASGHSVGVWAGQSAMAGSGEVLKVEGGGHKEPVMTADGEIVPSRAADRGSDKDAPFSSGLGSGDGHTSHGGGGGSGPTGGADNPGGGGGGTDAGGGGSPGEGNGSGPDGGGGGGAGDGDGNADGGGAGDGGGGTDGGGAGDGGGGTGPDGTDEDNDGGGGTDGGGAGGGGTGTGGGGGAGGGPGDDTGGTGEDDGGTGEDDGGTGEDDEDEDDGDDDDDDDSDEDDDEDDEDDDEDDEDDD